MDVIFQKNLIQKTRLAPLLSAFLLLTGCGEAPKAPEVAFIPCPAPVVAPGIAAGDARRLFFKIFCNVEPGQPAPTGEPLSINKLWGIDPANPTEEFQIEPNFLGGSLASVIDGTWDAAGWNVLGRVPNQKTRFMIYAKADADGNGRFYKVSALRSDGVAPTPLFNAQLLRSPLVNLSNEIGNIAFCGGYALADYSDINQSLYLYTDAGTDRQCSTRDDNVEKIMRLNMGPSDTPIVIPNDRSDLIDYPAPFSPGVVSATNPIQEKGLSILTDLVNKDNGGIAGWLVTKSRFVKGPLQPAFRVRDYNHDTLETDLDHGFSEGMPVEVASQSGVIFPTGLAQHKIYYVHVTSPRTFKLYRIKKQETPSIRRTDLNNTDPAFKYNYDEDLGAEYYVQQGLDKNLLEPYTQVELVGGKLAVENTSEGHDHPQLQDCDMITLQDGSVVTVDPACTPDPVPTEKWTYHRDTEMIDIVFEGDIARGGVVQPQSRLLGLYRYNKDLTVGGATPLKETKYMNICTVSGHNQGLVDKDSNVPAPFVIQVTNQDGVPVAGVPITWKAISKEETSCNIFGSNCTTKKAVISPTSGLTDANGFASATGATGPEEKARGNVFIASIGAGGKVSFAIGDVHDYYRAPSEPHDPLDPLVADPRNKKKTPLSCGIRPDFVMTNIIPMGYGNIFTGKMFIRFDLSFKPYPDADESEKPTKEDREKAKKIGTMGAVYLYDVAANSLGAAPQYTSASYFTNGGVEPFLQGNINITDQDAIYFFDNMNGADSPIATSSNPTENRTLVRLPFIGGGSTILATETGRQEFSQLERAESRVIYSTIDRSVEGGEETTLKSVNKTGGGAVTLLNTTKSSLGKVMTSGPFVYFQTQGAAPVRPFDPNNPGAITNGVLSKIIAVREDGTNRGFTNKASYAGRTDSRILAIEGCQDFTFSCAQGTLLSFDSLNPTIAPITLGSVPIRHCGDKSLYTTALYFEGMGEDQFLLEGDTSCGGSADGDGDSAGNDLFYVQEDQSGSLVSVTTTPNVPETLP
jgi:hypothetical protein